MAKCKGDKEDCTASKKDLLNERKEKLDKLKKKESAEVKQKPIKKPKMIEQKEMDKKIENIRI